MQYFACTSALNYFVQESKDSNMQYAICNESTMLQRSFAFSNDVEDVAVRCKLRNRDQYQNTCIAQAQFTTTSPVCVACNDPNYLRGI